MLSLNTVCIYQGCTLASIDTSYDDTSDKHAARCLYMLLVVGVNSDSIGLVCVIYPRTFQALRILVNGSTLSPKNSNLDTLE